MLAARSLPSGQDKGLFTGSLPSWLLRELQQHACDAVHSLVAARVAVGHQHGAGLELEQQLGNACKHGTHNLCSRVQPIKSGTSICTDTESRQRYRNCSLGKHSGASKCACS